MQHFTIKGEVGMKGQEMRPETTNVGEDMETPIYCWENVDWFIPRENSMEIS